MQKTLEQYDNVTSKCKALFEKKMYDYGSAWRILRLSSLTYVNIIGHEIFLIIM